MAKANQRVTQNYRIKPLTFATPLLKDESITSWLIRAALNQGCSPQTLTYYFWPNYRIWTYDVDKGFNHIDPTIHTDMAILAITIVDNFNSQTLISFSQFSSFDISSRKPLPWTQPLSKRNRYSRVGYPHCPDCIENSKSAYLQIQWRFTWSICCTEHRKLLQINCLRCSQPYQPQLINTDQRYINHCHICRSKLGETDKRLVVTESIYRFQLQADKVFNDKQGVVLGKTVSINDWFDYLIFTINMVRIALRNPSYMFAKLLLEFNISISGLSLPKTALRFDYLPIEERAVFLEHAFRIFEITSKDWVSCCQKLSITQNSFQWSKRTVIPKAFYQVYNQLPKTPRRKYVVQEEDLKPTSPEAVMASWNRLNRKMKMMDSYEKRLKKTHD